MIIDEFCIILISISGSGDFTLTDVDQFETLSECFEERELLVESIGRPIVNYQVICVNWEK